MHMTWTEEVLKEIEPIYEKIIASPFVSELANGTLAIDRFMEYMVQDKLYLNEYAKALNLIAARMPLPSDTTMWSKFSLIGSIAEVQLHDFYIENYNLNEEMEKQLKTGQKNPTNELYTSFLLRHAALSPMEVAVAAILPCYYIYDKVGRHHAKILNSDPNNKKNNKYAKWIETYSGELIANYSDVDGRFITGEFVNKLAENTTPEIRNEMTKAFITSSVCEYKFWNAAYDDEQWI